MDFVGLVDSNCNTTIHLVTKQSPFNVAYGVEPFQPIDLALKEAHSTLEFNQHGEHLA